MNRFAAGLAVAAMIVVRLPAQAQAGRRDPAASPSACWRFAFGEWEPPLDWARAGHAGDSAGAAARTQRIRDSVYDRDSVATRNNAMEITPTKDGMLVMLYPSWWPAGVKLSFDSTLAGGQEMVGTAVALVSDARVTPPSARARARQFTCPP